MRRQDRAVIGLENILSILDKCEIMRLGLSVDDKPYIVPMCFAYELADGDVSIYFHCAAEGRKISMIAQNNNVCFEADCSYKTLKAEDACEWSAEYESVIGEGIASVVIDEGRKIHALDLLMERYGFEGKPHYSPDALLAVVVLCVNVITITGKCRLTNNHTI